MAAKDLLRNHWPSVAITVTAAAFGCVALVMLWTMPPRSIVMATGPEGGTYYELGEQYRAALADAGVEVRLMPTAGSVENLALLRDPNSGVSVQPHLGNMPIQKLRAVHLNELYGKLLRNGRVGGGELSAKTVGHV